jgi:hypothetical protein
MAIVIGGGAVVVTAASMWSPAWRLAAQRPTPAPVPGNGAPVRTVPGGTRVVGDPGKKGDTYYWLESQTTRLTTRFADATVVAERGAGGEVRARVHDADGNEAASFSVRSNSVQYVAAGSRSLQALNDSGERPTLDWANRQAYTLWKDRGAGTRLSWQAGLMRPEGAPKRDLEREIVELNTEWAGGLAVRTRRGANLKFAFTDTGSKKVRNLAGDALTARLTRQGVEVGSSAWFVQDKLFMWNVPNLSQGYFSADQLKDFGGWPFVPDAAWVNLQTIAFYHFKTQIDEKGFVARNDGVCGPGGASVAHKLLNFFAPTVHANEPGCDGLHWLDGTIFRYCCDVHDFCYEKYGCSAHSWWQFWSSWRCDACNAWAAWCFADGGCTCIPPFAWLQPEDDRATRVKQVQT